MDAAAQDRRARWTRGLWPTVYVPLGATIGISQSGHF